MVYLGVWGDQNPLGGVFKINLHGEQLILNGNGLYNPRDPKAIEYGFDPESYSEEVLNFLTKSISILYKHSNTYDTGSYGLKHVLEDFVGCYISNGQAILAAMRLSYMSPFSMKSNSLNAQFKLSKRKKVYTDENNHIRSNHIAFQTAELFRNGQPNYFTNKWVPLPRSSEYNRR